MCPYQLTQSPLAVTTYSKGSSTCSGTRSPLQAPSSTSTYLDEPASPRTPRATQPRQYPTTANILVDRRSPSSQQPSPSRRRIAPGLVHSARTRTTNRTPPSVRHHDASSSPSHWSDDIHPLAEIDTSPLSTPLRHTRRRLNKAVTFTDDTKTNDGDSPTSHLKLGVKPGKPTLGSPVYERPQHMFHVPRDGYMPRDEVSAFSDSSDDEGANSYDKLKLKRLMHMRRRINLDLDPQFNLREGTTAGTRPSSSASNATTNSAISRQLSQSSTTDSFVSPTQSSTSPIQRRQARVHSPDLVTGITSLSIDTSYHHHFQRNSDSSYQSTISNSTLPTPTSSFTSDTPSFVNPTFAFAAPLPPVSRVSPTNPVFHSGVQYAEVPTMAEGGAVKRLMKGLKERGSLRDLRRAVRDRKTQ